MVLFAGGGDSQVFNDTWVIHLDSLIWHRLNILGPTPRWGHIAVYDSLHHRMVVFGGRDANSFLPNETFSLDLTPGQEQWIQLYPSGTPPSQREALVGVTDPVRNRMIVHGGYFWDGSYWWYNDTYSLSLTPGQEQWVQILPGGTPPTPARRATSITFDEVNQRLVVFGGGQYGVWFDDTYSYDLAQDRWKTLGSALAPRSGGTMIVDRQSNRAILFGGYTGSRLNDLWALDMTSGQEKWAKLSPSGTPPVGRSGQTAIWDEANRRMVVFAGSGDTQIFGDTWVLSLDSLIWHRLNIFGPTPRWGHTAVYDSANHRMIVFGGRDASDFLPNETYALDLTPGRETWSYVNPTGTPPSRREAHIATIDPTGNRMLLHGGYFWLGGSWYFYNDIYEMTLTPGQERWAQLTPSGVPPTPPRRASAGTREELTLRWIVFGGEEFNNYHNDVYAFDFARTTWTQLSPSGTPPTPRRYSMAIYDAPNLRMILMGGYDGANRNDTYELTLPLTGVEVESKPIPLGWEVREAVPNPSRGATSLEYILPHSSLVTIQVFDIKGRMMRVLCRESQSPGRHWANWDGRDSRAERVPGGIYFLQFRVGDITDVKKIILIR
jgi:N-acetylneuraminic acid mutarotase